ncbi:hypothetical protein [Jannaschia sp. R86511]|uniref:hypothetical protein n=1 Tax=Jannaschia sp. R86511 TaxID=3093853 RepID=UPI0036D310FA
MTGLEFAGLVITQAVILVGVLVSARRAGQARSEATEAKDLAAPTGNGFARRIEGKLDAVVDAVQRLDGRVARNEYRLDDLEHPGRSNTPGPHGCRGR